MEAESTGVQVPKIIRVPFVHATDFNIVWTLDNCAVVLGRAAISFSKDKISSKTELSFEPVEILNLSPHSAKKLSFLLNEGIKNYEDAYGHLKIGMSAEPIKSQMNEGVGAEAVPSPVSSEFSDGDPLERIKASDPDLPPVDNSIEQTESFKLNLTAAE